MIIYLILSIVFSGLLFLILKKFPDWKVVTLHGIMVNYFVAANLSLFLSNLDFENTMIHVRESLPFTMVMGLLFVVVFLLTGKTAQLCGMAVSSISSKMSMIIPIFLGIYLYGEVLNLQKTIGFAIALPAIILTGNQSNGKSKLSKQGNVMFLPLLLFLGAGLVDASIKYAQFAYMDESNQFLVMSMIFASAGFFALIKIVVDFIGTRAPFSINSFWGGTLLGISNFFSLYFLVQCLDRPDVESSHVFAIVNVGVVLMSFILGLVFFKEKPSQKQRIGLLLAVIAIFILAW